MNTYVVCPPKAKIIDYVLFTPLDYLSKHKLEMAFAAMYDTLGRPPVMLVDLQPVSSPMLVIGSYEVAEQISKASSQFPYGPPKDLEVWAPFVHLAGTTSILNPKVSNLVSQTRMI